MAQPQAPYASDRRGPRYSIATGLNWQKGVAADRAVDILAAVFAEKGNTASTPVGGTTPTATGNRPAPPASKPRPSTVPHRRRQTLADE